MAPPFAKLALGSVLLLQVAFVMGNSRCLDDNCESCNARKGTPCYKCQEGYVLKEDLGNSYCACEDPACNLCTTNGTCTQCFVGYGLDEEQSCQPCSDSNCSWCGADYQTCTECAMGFSLVDDKCEACPEGCTACNGTQCTECGYGYSLQEGECVACEDKNCRTCADPTTCDECAPSYGDVNGECKQCTDPVCLTCDGKASVCTECRGNRYVAVDGKCVITSEARRR